MLKSTAEISPLLKAEDKNAEAFFYLYETLSIKKYLKCPAIKAN